MSGQEFATELHGTWVQWATYQSRRERHDLILSDKYLRFCVVTTTLRLYASASESDCYTSIDLGRMKSVTRLACSTGDEHLVYLLRISRSTDDSYEIGDSAASQWSHRLRKIRRPSARTHIIRFAPSAPQFYDTLLKPKPGNFDKLKCLIPRRTSYRQYRARRSMRRTLDNMSVQLSNLDNASTLVSDSSVPSSPSSSEVETPPQTPAESEFMSCCSSSTGFNTCGSRHMIFNDEERNPFPEESVPLFAEEAGPPFTSLARLINSPVEVRSSTWPTPDEFNIMLEFETLLESGTMTSQGWQQKVRQKTIRLYVKSLPKEISPVLLIAGTFERIKAPPEIIVTMIWEKAQRMSWDTNILATRTIEENDIGDIEHSVCKFPSPLANREFLKYRIRRFEYQDYPYVIVSRSCERDECPVGKGNVRAESIINGYVIRPVEGDPWQTNISIALSTDVKGSIPSWVVGFTAARVPGRWVKNLEAAALKYMKANNIERGHDLSYLTSLPN